MPVWHASIALLDPRRRTPISASRWTFKQLTKARGRLADLLAGVGTDRDDWSTLDVSYHLRRPLTAAEIARLSPAWRALPAIDGANP